MKTQLKPKTVPVKEVTKSSPSAGASSKASKERDLMAYARAKLMPGEFSGMQVAKLKNQ